MKTVHKVLLAAAVMAFFVLLSAVAQPPQGQHPAYLHALTDLRHARAHLERPDHGELREQEKKDIHEIEAAIDEIKKAAALELLDKAHSDIAREEDNRFAQGLQQRAFEHIDKVHHHVQEAIEIIR
jgi:hypothetical protein